MKKLNFVLLVGEDAGRALGCYGDPDANTPNLDRLASQGCRFNNAFSTAPVCSPSRATLVTGMYSWALGTHHHRSELIQPPRLFTHELRQAGYYVNWANKTDFNFHPPTDYADETREWIEDLEQNTLPEQPFFLYHNFTVTHESTMWPDSDQRFGSHNKERLTKSHLLAPEHKIDPQAVRVPSYLPNKQEVREDIARFYEAQTIADAEIGRVLKALDNSTYRDNTVVIYLTDHGRGLLREKRWCYDAGLHLSLLVRAPGVTIEGSIDQALVSWVDVAPTILSLAGVAIPEHYQGQVFLGPGSSEPRNFVFAGRDRMDEAFDCCRSVRGKRYHYIRNIFPQIPYAQRMWYLEIMKTTQVMRNLAEHGELSDSEACWAQPQKPAEELYDAQRDPDMVNNLINDPTLAQELHSLRAALAQNTAKWGDLGLEPERALINRGLVTDVLENMHSMVDLLPQGQRIGVDRTIVEMPVNTY